MSNFLPEMPSWYSCNVHQILHVNMWYSRPRLLLDHPDSFHSLTKSSGVSNWSYYFLGCMGISSHHIKCQSRAVFGWVNKSQYDMEATESWHNFRKRPLRNGRITALNFLYSVGPPTLGWSQWIIPDFMWNTKTATDVSECCMLLLVTLFNAIIL